MEQSINDFQYRPLLSDAHEIRLIHIQPGPFSAPIDCTLQHVPLDQAPTFEALSYVWGDPKDVVAINSEGREFHVTKNLFSALKHLRLAATVRLFWIDALSINQRDKEERSLQVQLMGEIYRTAIRTTVWLGPEMEKSAMAFEFMIERAEERHLIKLYAAQTALAERWLQGSELRKRPLEKEETLLDMQRNLREGSTLHGFYADELFFLRQEKERKLEEFTKEYKFYVVEQARSQARIKALMEEVERGGSRHTQVSLTSSLTELFVSNPPSTQDRSTRHLLERKSAILAARFSRIDGPAIVSARELEVQSSATPVNDPFEVPVLSHALFKQLYIGFNNIWGHPWWSRVWIIQEVATSSDVVFQCGNSAVTWYDFHSTINHSSTNFMTGHHSRVLQLLNVRKRLEDERTLLENTPQDTNRLLHLLQRFRYCRATDPLDKVYALLRLAEDVRVENSMINYETTPEDLYKYVATRCLEQQKTLDILGYVLTQDEDGVGDLPSWVPDWSAATSCNPFHDRILSGDQDSKFYDASGSSEAFANFSSTGNFLSVRGVVFDVVGDICRTAVDFSSVAPKRFNTQQQHRTIVQQWENKALEFLRNGNPYRFRCTRLEAFWRTVIADSIGDARATDEAVHMFNVWSGRAPVHVDTRFTEPYVTSLERASRYRKFCLSSRGYMALAPVETVMGDWIVVLFGGQTPFVLRKNGDHFGVIGPCYVHGIMNGEAMELAQAGKLVRRDFVLR